MFNVSALWLDDAFKPATPLTNGVISETLWQFVLLSDISQGSVATTLVIVRSLVTDWRYCKFSPDSERKNFRKICKYLIKLQHTKNCAKFFGQPCKCLSCCCCYCYRRHFLRPKWHKIGQFKDVLASQSLSLEANKSKQHKNNIT